MKNIAVLIAGLLTTATLAAPVAAQCGGEGPATLEIISVNDKPIVSGSKIILRLRGTPNTFFCLICDFGAGPVKVPGIGTFCVDLSPNLFEFVATFPASGVVEFPVTLPANVRLDQLCCQWFGADLSLNLSGLSNAVCTPVPSRCDGGVAEVSFVTSVDLPKSFPATITATATGSQGNNSQSFKAEFQFDPTKPPVWPVTNDKSLFIEKVSVNGDKLDVVIRASASNAKNGRLNNNMVFSVNASKTPVVHLSCSLPIGVGMLFGGFRVTGLVSAK